MIGLTVLALAIGWLFASAKIARFFARRFTQPDVSLFVGVAVFVAFALLPFVDEIAGRWQFRRLCNSEATVWTSADASKVTAAEGAYSTTFRDGLIFPVQQQSAKYMDAMTGVVFYTVNSFYTPGGLVMRAGLNMGSSTACRPQMENATNGDLKLNELLRRGGR